METHEFDTSDRCPAREYTHNEFTGHKGVYFGTGMEFEADLDIIDQPFSGTGTRLYKSHEWAYQLDEIKARFPDAWIVMVYASNNICFEWWKQAGGFDIPYPNYDWYHSDIVMKARIREQNDAMLRFGVQNNLSWKPHDTIKHFDQWANEDRAIRIATYKP